LSPAANKINAESPRRETNWTFLVVTMATYAGVPVKKSQLRDLFLRLCWQHEMAANRSLGHCIGRGGAFNLAQFW